MYVVAPTIKPAITIELIITVWNILTRKRVVSIVITISDSTVASSSLRARGRVARGHVARGGAPDHVQQPLDLLLEECGEGALGGDQFFVAIHQAKEQIGVRYLLRRLCLRL
eukprot:COSAG05_NODE_3674_length_1914_cov_2.499725_1_plen_112_part_00